MPSSEEVVKACGLRTPGFGWLTTAAADDQKFA
jgi:hypothetical protein